ncbi:class I SAM-dependent methyltransferase [Candidatus Saccharibacteria bacterium]|nr:class I SAM-dependent methyltransferase [Candidatus Saccharibacteria bacterium]
MVEKRLLTAILNRLKHGGLQVEFWDGEIISFGPVKPYCTIVIKHPRVVRAIIKNPSLGFGEAYINGQVEVRGDIIGIPRLADENQAVFAKVAKYVPSVRPQANKRSKQRQQIAHHYDLGNDFYKLWLDESMLYSCAYFKTPTDTLELAQKQKVEHILRKLQLKPGLRLLDIGSGWGQLLIAAAQQYDISGIGVTLSEEQFKLSNQRIAALGLQDRIEVKLMNYQDLAEQKIKFDRIASVGMYEHVGIGNHHNYFEAVRKMLSHDGLSVLHTITNRYEAPNDPWIDKYIFPGGYLPTVAKTASLIEQFDFELQDYENLRYHYALTLEEWRRRYEAHKEEIISMYDERFYRMWELYLAGSVNGFRHGNLTLSQFVMTAGPNPNGPLTRDHLYR